MIRVNDIPWTLFKDELGLTARAGESTTYNQLREDCVGDEHKVGVSGVRREVEDHPDGVDRLRLHDGLHNTPVYGVGRISRAMSPYSSVVPPKATEK